MKTGRKMIKLSALPSKLYETLEAKERININFEEDVNAKKRDIM